MATRRPAGPTPDATDDDGPHAAAKQEFLAGAHPSGRDLVVRTGEAHHVLVVAVDETRQRRVADLFAAADRRARLEDEAVAATWRTLRDPSGALDAIRLDVDVDRPVRVRLRIAFHPTHSVVARRASTIDRVALVTHRAFDDLEETGRCTSGTVVLPTTPDGDLVAALAA